jgi:BirA family transcriptional regulator, biotin operon repressor / biotin---[acetyl-CoA-carboxylase] ligase
MTTLGSAVPSWDGLSAEDLARRCGVPKVMLLGETDSTLDIAHILASRGAPEGTVVLADYQRAGRGRMGRVWTSAPGLGVWCTVIERPRDPKALDVLSIRVGLRAADALDAFAGERVGLKWPNDLILAGGKVGGILSEARWTGASVAWVAVGVGINVVRPPAVPTAAGLRAGVRRVDVLAAVVGAISSAGAAEGELSAAELERYGARDTLKGRRIVSPAVGSVAGITSSGALVVETMRGSEEHRAGTIRLAEDA